MHNTYLPYVSAGPQPVWKKDFSGGLVSKVASQLTLWSLTGDVTWNAGGYAVLNDTDGAAESMTHAFTEPGDNWFVDACVRFPAAAGSLSIVIQTAGGASDLFTLTINGATGAVTINGNAVTPADYDPTVDTRFRLVVRPDTTDVLAYAYYYNAAWYHKRLAEGGGTKVWTYAGTPAVLKISTAAVGTGAVYVRDVTVKPVLGVVIGDSIATGHDSAANDKGYDPAPHYTAGRSGYTHSMAYWLEDYLSPSHSSAFLFQGTGGDSLQDVIDRLSDFAIDPLAGMADPLVILHAGTNIEGDAAEDGSQALAKLDTILAALDGAGIQVVFGDIIPRTGYNASQNLRRGAFNAGLAARVTATAKAALYSTNCPNIAAAGNANTLSTEYTNDGTHLFWTGYKYLAPELIRAYKSLP